MPYTNCASCGAKALVGATRCPRCQVPFVSYATGADRVPTINCPNCGVQRPVAIGVCPNCLMSSAPRRGHVTRGAIMTGAVIATIIAIGYGVSRVMGGSPATPPPAAAIVVDSTGVDTVVSDSALARMPDSVPVAAVPVAAAPVVSAPIDPAMVPPKPSPRPEVAVPDTGRWESFVALTWVRVRSSPERGSAVLRMIDSAQRVRLGPSRNGWRAVRVGTDRGWVDPRLFRPVP